MLQWPRWPARCAVILTLVALAAGALAALPGVARAGGARYVATRAEPRRVPTVSAAASTAAMYAAVRARAGARDARAVLIPPFARKYGMKCSACHNAVPELNEYGRAFRDNGYRMRNGTDDLRTRDPAAWPIFAWAFKNYQLDTERSGGRRVQEKGGMYDGSAAFGVLGAIGDHVSVRYVPQIYEGGRVIVDQGWIRYNRAFNTDWVNVKVGSSEFDLPWSAGRDLNVGDARLGTMWFYGVPGSTTGFSLFAGAPGVEVMGHDRGSYNRYVVHLFNANNAPGAHRALTAPGVFSHLTHRIPVANGFVRDVTLGVFGAYATWPTGADSSTLRPSRRVGGEVESWLASDALPLHITLVGMRGSDDRALIPGAVRAGTYHAGLLQVDYVPALPVVVFGRLQAIRNQRQAVPGRPDDYGDQNFYQGGVRHALELNSRFATILELSYSRQQIRRVGADAATAGHDIVWAGMHLIF